MRFRTFLSLLITIVTCFQVALAEDQETPYQALRRLKAHPQVVNAPVWGPDLALLLDAALEIRLQLGSTPDYFQPFEEFCEQAQNFGEIVASTERSGSDTVRGELNALLDAYNDMVLTEDFKGWKREDTLRDPLTSIERLVMPKLVSFFYEDSFVVNGDGTIDVDTPPSLYRSQILADKVIEYIEKIRGAYHPILQEIEEANRGRDLTGDALRKKRTYDYMGILANIFKKLKGIETGGRLQGATKQAIDFYDLLSNPQVVYPIDLLMADFDERANRDSRNRSALKDASYDIKGFKGLMNEIKNEIDYGVGKMFIYDGAQVRRSQTHVLDWFCVASPSNCPTNNGRR